MVSLPVRRPHGAPGRWRRDGPLCWGKARLSSKAGLACLSVLLFCAMRGSGSSGPCGSQRGLWELGLTHFLLSLKIFEMMDAKARQDCVKEIGLLKVSTRG